MKFLFYLTLLLAPKGFLFAEGAEYVPLVDLPSFGGGGSDLGSYLNQIFFFGLAIAIILAVLMIIWGGVLYMGGDSVFNKDDGRKKITAAIGGLILALAAWLILNTINPNIIKSSAKFEQNLKDNSVSVRVESNFDSDGNGVPDYIQKPSSGLEFGKAGDTGSLNQAAGNSTYYGYANDEYFDYNSSVGIGSFSYTLVKDPGQNMVGKDSAGRNIVLLKPGDLAVSPDIEASFRSKGVKPGDNVKLYTSDGRTVNTRWMDRTSKTLSGRYDFYSPSGPQDNFKVTGFEKAQ